ncbi:phage holin family protein [Haloactinomyces albus]|uniref:Membrane protein YqjE n=1 Tax=Haloactinomyces albus TaxID=1352928 RepID=A0AAE4CJN1_9ACTN|nr:phage holin family protein [Haloactinomyces albus]MDR7300220.1 putative membrane protein YqjE [Haloactinomyces albus]
MTVDETQDTHRTPASQRSTAELVRDLGDQLTELIRTELRLAQRELLRKGKEAGMGAALFGAAGVVGGLGAVTILAAVILLLTIVLPAWLSTLIAGALLLLIAGAIAAVGRSQLKKSTPLMPEDAVSGAQWDARMLKEATKK